MSEIILGIDLGTTNSCVAVQGDFPNCQSIDDVTGYVIVSDEFDRGTTPSVVKYLEEEKIFEVGHEAKNMLEDSFPPIMFAKRDLGTDKQFEVAENYFLSPEAISAETLKYLKKMAEEKLGRRINKAVVTVPAYFGLIQKNLTQKAMVEAGFIVDDDRCIIQEPVAAALAYTQMNTEKDLRILVYDLGGGTFDITVLDKQGSLIEVVKFGGDPALGGYDFDRCIADYLVDQLISKGYQLDLDTENDTMDKVRYSKLLLIAEDLKIKLSKSPKCSCREPNLFKDKQGKTVSLTLSMDRFTLEGLIKDKVEETIRICLETLEEAGLEKNQIDKVIMVGGSCYIPLIQKRLKEEFDQTPELVEPDLCVALGAAVYAYQMGLVVEEQGLSLKFDPLPSRSSENTVAISGKISSQEEEKSESEYTIEVLNQLGMKLSSDHLKESQRFYLEVDLEAEAENIFTIKVSDSEGNLKLETQLPAIHQVSDTSLMEEPDELTETVGANNLPKSIRLKRSTGYTDLAPEGVELPYEKKEKFKVAKTGAIADTDELNLNVELFEESLKIGEVEVKQIPGYIENDAPVEITIKISPDYQIIASAFLPSVDRKGSSVFSMSKIVVKSVGVLKENLVAIENEWENLKLMLNADDLAKFGPKVGRILKKVKEAMAGHQPDTSEASKQLSSLRLILNDIKEQEEVVLQPSKKNFESLCGEVRDLIKKAEKFEIPGIKEMDLERSLDTIINQANQAYKVRNAETWKAAYQQIEELGSRTHQAIRQVLQPDEEPDPHQLYMQCKEIIRELRQKAIQKNKNPNYGKWIEELNAIHQELEAIKEEQQEKKMLKKTISLYQTRIAPLRDEILGSTTGQGIIIVN